MKNLNIPKIAVASVGALAAVALAGITTGLSSTLLIWVFISFILGFITSDQYSDS